MKFLNEIDGADKLIEDTGHRLVSDTEKENWNNKADISDFPTSLPANGGNADTVNGLTVQTAVPLNAKFTDTNTTYSVISTAEIDTGTASTSRVINAQRLKYISDKLKITIGTTQPTSGWWFKEI